MDIFMIPKLDPLNLALHDIDEERLATTVTIAERLARQLNSDVCIEASVKRRSILLAADFVITMMQIGGYEPCTVTDFEIPKKYGLQQTIGDTLGIGGIMRGLRSIPVMLDLCQDMMELCPRATLLNYVNPMAMLCQAIAQRFPRIKVVGLCHSVEYTVRDLAKDLEIPPEEIEYLSAGINHLAFFLKLEHTKNGISHSLYPRLRQLSREGRFPKTNSVRYDILQRLGYFVTESSEHFSEYVPWFIKKARPELIEDYHIPIDEYMRRCEKQIADWDKTKQELEKGTKDYELEKSVECADKIIAAMAFNEPAVISGNVANHNGVIANLPRDCCVEVPCLVNANGIQPVAVGNLPTHLAALMQTNINVQKLTLEASLTGQRERIYQAAMLDPHTAAELSLDEIWALVDELIEAHGDWLPSFH